jgi:Fungal Zn(2)-Cys(6) binuclear cluster domain
VRWLFLAVESASNRSSQRISRADLFRLKCNREKPCQNCIVRGESNAASCTYAEKVEKKNSAKSNPRSDAEDMRKRLNRLEKSILSMMSSDEKSGNQSKESELPGENGKSTIESPNQAGGQRICLDTRSTHWDAILNDVSQAFVEYVYGPMF